MDDIAVFVLNDCLDLPGQIRDRDAEAGERFGRAISAWPAERSRCRDPFRCDHIADKAGQVFPFWVAQEVGVEGLDDLAGIGAGRCCDHQRDAGGEGEKETAHADLLECS